MTARRFWLLLLLTLYISFLLDLALLQFPAVNPPPNLMPLHSMIGDWRRGGRDLVVNFAGNLIAFIPIGVIPPLVWPDRWTARHAGLFSLALSALIEITQYSSGRRVADVDDLILNTLGGLIGYSLLFWPRGRDTAGERPRGQ
jgi:glycopeptide antibiotics resistance protein